MKSLGTRHAISIGTSPSPHTRLLGQQRAAHRLRHAAVVVKDEHDRRPLEEDKIEHLVEMPWRIRIARFEHYEVTAAPIRGRRNVTPGTTPQRFVRFVERRGGGGRRGIVSQIASERGTGGGIASERGSRHKRNTPPFLPSPCRASHHERSSPPFLPPLAASTAVTARRGGASDGGARRARAPHRPQQRTRLIERDARVGDHEQHGLRRGGEDSAVRHDGRLKPTTHAGVTVARPIAAAARPRARASRVSTPTSSRRPRAASAGACRARSEPASSVALWFHLCATHAGWRHSLTTLSCRPGGGGDNSKRVRQ